MEHVKFASDLGIAIARAKFAAENPEAEVKFSFWTQLPAEQKAALLELNSSDEAALRTVYPDIQR